MAHSHQWSLAVAELIIYLILIPFLLYLLFRHGKRGILGWFYLNTFAILQIVGAGLTISASDGGSSSSAEGAAIVSSIGLSPLILGIAGLVSEVIWTEDVQTRFLGTLPFEILFHLLVVGAAVITAVGAVHALSNDPGSDHSRTTWRVGILIMLLVWIILCAFVCIIAVQSHRQSRRSKLIPACLVTLPVILARVIDVLCTGFAGSNSTVFNIFSPNLAAEVILSVIPGMLVILITIIAGFLARPSQGNKGKAGNAWPTQSMGPQDPEAINMKAYYQQPQGPPQYA